MSPTRVFRSEEATVDVYPDGSFIHLIWNGNASGAKYRLPVEKLIETVKQYSIVYFLSDTRRMGPILYADTEWTEKVVIPELITAGVRRSAVLSSRDVLNMIAIDNMVASIPAEAPYVVAFFATTEEAMKWLYKDAPLAAPILLDTAMQ